MSVLTLPRSSGPVCYQDGISSSEALNIPALVSVGVFYALIVAIGIYVSWRHDRLKQNTESYILAGRELGLFVGIVTLTGMCGNFRS